MDSGEGVRLVMTVVVPLEVYVKDFCDLIFIVDDQYLFLAHCYFDLSRFPARPEILHIIERKDKDINPNPACKYR